MNTQDKVLVESANTRQTPSVAAVIAPPNKLLTLCLATFLLHYLMIPRTHTPRIWRQIRY